MLVENQIVKTKWSSNNREWYENKGYVFTKYRDILSVEATDLMHSSGVLVLVECDYCGHRRMLSYEKYYKSITKYGNYACKKCVGRRCADVTLEKRRVYLYKKIVDICNNIGYTLVTKKEKIINNKMYIDYICCNGHKNKMKIANFVTGKRCPDCTCQNNSKKFKKSDDLVEYEIKKCGGLWNNKGEYINQYEKNLLISCPNCGEYFKTSYVLFTQHGGQLCPDCSKKISIGESKIKKYLEDNGIIYIREKWFEDCRDSKPLPFDFFLPEYNTCIEFDGKQHFYETHFFHHTSTSTVKAHDEIKNSYCSQNSINLIRIPYWDIHKIDDILQKNIKSQQFT